MCVPSVAKKQKSQNCVNWQIAPNPNHFPFAQTNVVANKVIDKLYNSGISFNFTEVFLVSLETSNFRYPVD